MAIVKVAEPAVVPERLTELVDPKLSVGASVAPAGLEVMAAPNVTFPINPEMGTGVTLTVDVLPLAAPGAIVTAVPLIVNPGAVVDTT